MTPRRATGTDQDTLKKYITFARASCKPILHNVDLEKIASLYADLRKQSAQQGVPITVRHIESVMRMAEASAKMHLRDHMRTAMWTGKDAGLPFAGTGWRCRGNWSGRSANA